VPGAVVTTTVTGELVGADSVRVTVTFVVCLSASVTVASAMETAGRSLSVMLALADEGDPTV
jgi:hypothetical protein